MMNNLHEQLKQLEQLVLDMRSVKRNHRIPGTEEREDVVVHSFSVLLLCWKLYALLKPDLDFEKITKYALVHDFPERGQEHDTNTYADSSEKEVKQKYEEGQIKKILSEFKDFKEMTKIIEVYDSFPDEESRFAWSVDKMQAMVLGDMDNWRPYRLYGVSWEEFCDKGDYFLEKSPECLKPVMQEVLEQSKKTYYDRPKSS